MGFQELHIQRNRQALNEVLNLDIHSHLIDKGFSHHGTMEPQMYSPMKTKYDVYKHPTHGGVAVQKNGQWHRFGKGERQSLTHSGKGLDDLKKSLPN